MTRSSRTHSMPTHASDAVEQKVLAARMEDREGPDVLSARIGVPSRAVSRILRRHGVLYQADSPAGPIRSHACEDAEAPTTSARSTSRRHIAELTATTPRQIIFTCGHLSVHQPTRCQARHD